MVWLENLLSQATVERLGWMLMHFLWQAVVVSLLLAAFLWLLRKSSANVRYLTACAALMLMVVLPIATMQFIEVPGPAAEAGPEPGPFTTAAPLPPATFQMPGQTFTPSDVPLETADMTAPVPWGERIASALEPALPYAVLGWLAGVFGLSAWHLGGWMQLQRLKRRMVHSVSSALQQGLVQIAGRLGVHRAVTLLESALVEVPTVVGWLRPVILLPASALTGLSPEQLESILAHELAHIRRYDYLVNVLQTVVEILGFYHPAVWWVSHRIRIERENCCDDVAVRLCGDSVRYARALTCLEEIRHGQTELAMAATGGSLLDRVARLLGRPAADDRRFAWLPGLITLLLVAGILIPTALALTAAESLQGRVSPAEEPTPTEGIEAPREPKQILLNVVVVQVASDQTLDRDTAIQARALLATAAAEGNTGVPSVEEFEKPLRQIIGKYVTGRTLPGDNAKAFTDLLIVTGHARVVTKPSVLTLEGQRARIVIGEDPNRETPGASSGADTFHVSLEATPTIQDDPNTILLSMGFHMENFVLFPHTDPRPIVKAKVADFRTVEAFRNKEYRILPLSVSADPGGDSVPVPANTLVLLIRATIAKEPAASPASEPNAPRIDLRTEIAGEPNAPMADDAHVMIKVKIIEAVDGNELNRETVTQIENILGKRVRPEGRAGEFGPRLHLTVGEVLRKHVVQQSLPNEAMEAFVELLAAKGYIKMLAAPAVVAKDGMQSQVKVTNDEYFRMGSSTDGSQQATELQKIEVGTILDVTSRVKDPNTIFMEIKVELSDIVPGPRNRIPPVISRRTVTAAVTTPSGRYVTLAGLTENNTSAQPKDSKSLYIIIMPSIVKPPERGIQARMEYVNSDPMYRELARQIVEVERELITDGQKLAPEHPQMIQKRALLDAIKSRLDKRKENLKQEFEDLRTGRTAAPANDKTQRVFEASNAPELPVTATFTNADLRDALAEIAKRGRASIATDETVKAQAVTTELAGASVEQSLLQVLRGTPYVFKKTGEAQNTRKKQRRITMTFQGDELRPALQDLGIMAGVTIVSSKTAVGRVYADIKDVPLETALEMVLAGTPYVVKKTPDYYLVTTGASLPGSKGQRIFEERPTASPWPQGTYLVYRPINLSFGGSSLQYALEDLAAASEVPIVVDGNVTGEVLADLYNVPLDTALRIILVGTPYVVEKKADHYEVSAPRTPTDSKAGTSSGISTGPQEDETHPRFRR